jgi:transcription elongation GreA/GreB family factor
MSDAQAKPTGSSKFLTRAELTALAADLRQLLDSIENGELDASAAMRHRLEGALAVLDVVQGRKARFEVEQQMNPE